MSKPFRLTAWPSDNPEGDWLLMDPDERDEWCEWFQRHGIDPDEVAVPGSVVADDLARRVSYLAYEVRDGGMDRVGRVVQLESPALPFPQQSPEWAPHFADPSCRCGLRCGSRFSGFAERADRRTT